MPHLRQTACLLVVFISGCSSDIDETFDAKRDRLNAELDAEYENRNSAVQEEARALLPAGSIEELVQAFEMAFNAGDFEAIEQMAHFENVDQQSTSSGKLKETLLIGYLAFRAADGQSHIETSSLRALEADETKDFWSLQPVMLYEYETRDNDDFGGSNHLVPIVEQNGEYRFYLCAVPQEKKKG